MSITFGFYDSVNGDRKYNAQQMSAIFDGIINDGVFDSVGEHFAVSPAGGMNVKVGTGRAWFDHTWTYNDSDGDKDSLLTVSDANAALPRIDAVVLEVNNDAETRKNTIKIVTGAPSPIAKRPTLTKDSEGGIYQHALAYITIEAGATEITNSMIRNMVGTSETPFVTGILETTTVDSLWTTWEGQFEDWFEHIKSELSTDQAGNLQNQIDACVKTANKATLAEARAGTNDTKWMTPAKTAALIDPLNQAAIGDIYYSARNIETETNGAFIALDGRVVDREKSYPELADIYDLRHRIAPPTVLETSDVEWGSSTRGGVFLNGLYFWIATYTSKYGSSYYSQLCVRKPTGVVEVLINNDVEHVVVCNNQVIAVTDDDSTVRAYVYDAKGEKVRDIQLNNSKSLRTCGVHVVAGRCFILCATCGYYSDDNFATFGNSLFDNDTAFTPAASYAPNSNGSYLGKTLKEYGGNLYFMTRSSTYRSEDKGYTYILNLWKSTDGGGSFVKMWSAEYRDDDTESGIPNNAYDSFLYNGYIYTIGQYPESSSSSTTHPCVLKLKLYNGECVAKSADISTSSSYTEFHGFIKDGYFYGTVYEYSCIKMDLNTLEFTSWYPIHDYKSSITLRDAIDIVTSDGRYWIAYGNYLYAPCDSDKEYGGIVVHHIPTGKGVYLTDGLEMFSSSLSYRYLGAAFEDNDGNIIVPQGCATSSSKFYAPQLNKIDFSKIEVPSIDLAYLKTRELTT